ncbi:protein-ADP-ribose hydrolase [Paenibacillus polysaccharolyticus]|uniref:protein-ADP-ribose hydrolase n=1 Tax=Paenibacillus polysaccharolyticus TaxID=582692 RepID=UPI00209F9343|nr:protein-ADP-ribose hydrolase [Paenibacillus polysaccharolyticus]MCP1136252.1 protein-ADP-ribose hydrolase [Paenibacillus polysaccharolyticus]
MKGTLNNLPGLRLEDYRKTINLDEAKEKIDSSSVTEDQYISAVNDLLNFFTTEGIITSTQIPIQKAEKRKLLHAIQNIWAKPLDSMVHQRFAIVLDYEKQKKGIVDINTLPTLEGEGVSAEGLPLTQLMIWKGDITRLKADVIVNAANNQLLGCFKPLHACIDNAIHTSAGPQLREDCQTIMSVQGHAEWTGDAKITRAHHLPSRFVLHTVGPIISHTPLSEADEESLASCYTSCLNLAAQVESIRSVAFCAISTGVFGYPKLPAANTAIRTVGEWVNQHKERFERVVFNVFSREDEVIYRSALATYGK